MLTKGTGNISSFFNTSLTLHRIFTIPATCRLIHIALMIVVAGAYAVKAQTPTVLSEGKAGNVYEFRFSIDGGQAPFHWRVSEGALPPGLNLLPSGTIGGKISDSAQSSYTFTVEVSDSSQPVQTFSQVCTIEVKSAAPSNPLRIVKPEGLKIVNTDQSRARTVKVSDPINATDTLPTEPPASAQDNKPAQKDAQPLIAFTGEVKENDKVLNGIAPRGTTEIDIEVRPQKTVPTFVTQKIDDTKDLQVSQLSSSIVYQLHLTTPVPESKQFSVTLPQPLTKTQQIQATIPGNPLATTGWIKVKAVKLNPEARDGELRRTIVGFEQVGASSADSVQKPFLDLFVSNPIPPSQGKLRIWGDIRITSVPQANTTVNTFASALFSPADTGKANQVVQSVAVTTGVEFKLKEHETSLLGFLGDNKQRVRMSLIAGGGFTTPLNPRDSLTEFKINDAARSMFNITDPKKTIIAFVLPDRDRFLRKYFAGFRFTTFYHDKDTDAPLNLLPATFDVTFGQDEAVTTRLFGTVMRLEGFYPLPFKDAKYVYLFGSASLKLHRAVINNNPLLLDLASPVVSPADPSVITLPTPQANRDVYRLGIGIDLLEALKPAKPKTDQDTPQ
jgi:hypothetical protein